MQWEFPGRLGPEPGRYVVRRFAGDDARQVVVIGGLEAPRRRRFGGGRKAERAEPGSAAAPVEVTRATVISATPFDDEERASAWLSGATGDRSEQVVTEALEVLNRAIQSHRLAAADPHVVEVSTRQATTLRVGFGRGEQVAEGDWESAHELPTRDGREGASMVLRPQERLAALLGGRDVALACEELALRARLDLDHGRGREAALQLAAALDAALAELEGWRGTGSMARRVDELAGHREAVRGAAEAALSGGLDEERTAVVGVALERLEAALKARVAAI